jgi:hypothetical protein
MLTEDLVDRLDFRDHNPEVIDLSPEGGVVATLRESMVECVSTDKVNWQVLDNRDSSSVLTSRTCTCITSSFGILAEQWSLQAV